MCQVLPITKTPAFLADTLRVCQAKLQTDLRSELPSSAAFLEIPAKVCHNRLTPFLVDGRFTIELWGSATLLSPALPVAPLFII
jgi:hypothetical protein